MTINGADNDDIPTLDLIGAGLTTNVAGITIGNNRRGRLLLRQGRSITSGGNDFAIGAAAGGEGFVSVQSGALLGVGVAGALVVGGVGTTPGGTGTLDISGGTVSVLALRLFRDGTINLSGGGLLAVDSILALDGQFNWTNGTLRLTAPFTLSGANVPKLLGSDATLRAGQVLASNPAVAVTLQTPLVVDGGSLSGSTLVNQSRLEVRSGVVGTVQNNGLIVGDGTIDGAVTNGAAGTIRVDAGDAIFFTGSVAPNAGELNLHPGTSIARTEIIAGTCLGTTVQGLPNVFVPASPTAAKQTCTDTEAFAKGGVTYTVTPVLSSWTGLPSVASAVY